jgi:hypothetical protein
MKSRAVLLLLVALVVVACRPNDDGTTIIITPTQTIVNPSPGVVVGTPGPAGTPNTGGGPIAFVAVGFFGGVCPSGILRNGTPLPVDCRGDITATPKDTAGNKLEPTVHGFVCTWTNDNPAAVTVFVDGENEFNAVLVTRAPGIARVCATVRTVTGCMTVEVV